MESLLFLKIGALSVHNARTGSRFKSLVNLCLKHDGRDGSGLAWRDGKTGLLQSALTPGR
jgi:putative heme iron utilization protein